MRFRDLILVLLVMLLALPAAAGAKVFSSGDVDRKLRDLGRVQSIIKVPANKTIAKAQIKLRMTHGYLGDLIVGIEKPDGDFEELVSQGAAAQNANPVNFGTGATSCKGQMTTFDDGASTPITNGFAPFPGTYRPSESISADGDSSKGQWRLIIFDTNQGDSGRLHCWKLNLIFAP